MNKKECFEKFILTREVSQEELTKAKEYYNEATPEEKKTFDMICSSIGKKILNSIMNKNDLKLKSLLRKYNLTPKDAEYMINKYTEKEESLIILLDYWSLNTKSLENYLKRIYEECLANNWQKEKLQALAKKLHISYEMLLQVLNEYLTKYSIDETITMSQILEKLELSKASPNQVNTPSSQKSKKEKSQLSQEIKNKRILESKYYKFVQMLLESANNTDIDRYVVEHKIRFHYFRSDYLKLLIEVYSTQHSIEEAIKFQEQIILAYDNYFKNRQVSKYYRFCLMLINNESITSLNKFATEEVLGLTYLKNKYIAQFIAMYKESHSEEETRKIANILTTNLRNFLMKRKEKEEIVNNLTAEEIQELKFQALAYIHGANAYSGYGSYKAKKLDDNQVILLSQIDSKLYALYCEKLSKHIHIDIKDIDRLVLYLQNGIIENDTVREFDIIDYYLIFNKPLEYILKAVKAVSADAEKLLRIFYNQNRPRLTTIQEIYSLNIEINCARDDKGFPIPGTGLMATSEEKTQIINYLISNNIPLTTVTYRIALNRYFNNQLALTPTTKAKM